MTAAEAIRDLFPARKLERLLLVAPPDADAALFDNSVARRGRYSNYPPYGLGIIATVARSLGIEVRLLNLNHEMLKAVAGEGSLVYGDFVAHAIRAVVTEFRPDMVGVTCICSMTHDSAVAVCREIRDVAPQLPLALGGVHVTNCFMGGELSSGVLDAYAMVDIFFLYESELSFRRFVDTVRGEEAQLCQIAVQSGGVRYIADGQCLPAEHEIDILPAHDLMKSGELSSFGTIGSFFCLKAGLVRVTTVLSNRGCRGGCAYCSVRNFNGPGVRHRSVSSVIEELTLLKESFGINHVMWLDDDFLFDGRRAINLFNEMVRSNLGITWDCTNGVVAASCTDELITAAAASGCIGLNLGIESGNPEILRRARKPGTVSQFLKAAEVLRKHQQINSRAYLMIGFPDETYSMVKDTLDLALEMKLDWYNINILKPLPNTEMGDEMMRRAMKSANSEETRFSTGPYAKKVGRALQHNPFDTAKGGAVPDADELAEIWSYMNYRINYDRLFDQDPGLKLDQHLKYLTHISRTVAPEDPIPLYFMLLLQQKKSGTASPEDLEILEALVAASDVKRKTLAFFGLCADDFKHQK